MKKLALAFAVSLLLAACGQDAQQSAQAPKTAPADQPAQPTAPKSADQAFADKLDTVLKGDWRSPEAKARDAYRHPKETLAFFGLKPGMTVIEITPPAGWYTEVLAPLMKDDGNYVAAIYNNDAIDKAEALKRPADYLKKANVEYRAKLAADTAHYGSVNLVEFDPVAPSFGAANSADLVLTFRNTHNWAKFGTAPQTFKAFFDVLKPGGVLGVTDHRAAAGKDAKDTVDSGYLPEEYVIKLAEDAGFKLADKSEINANPKDTKDYEKGVWTLPPTLALGEKDKEKYLAVGESDRMTLKFVKPKNDAVFKAADDTKKQ